METAGLLKPGTASTFLKQGTNSLTSVLKSPAVWTGAGGVTNLDSFLKNPAAQNLTQQNLMSSGLATAKSLGLPTNLLAAGDLGGVSAVFAKDSAAGADWIRGQLPPDKQAEFDSKFKDAQFAVNTADQKLNDAVLQQAPPGEASDTVNRATVDAASTRVVGNEKVPNINYGNEKADQTLVDENKALRKEIGALLKRIVELNASSATASQAEAKIAQLISIRSGLEIVREKAAALRSKVMTAKPYSESLYQKLNEELGDIGAAITDINSLIKLLRQLK